MPSTAASSTTLALRDVATLADRPIRRRFVTGRRGHEVTSIVNVSRHNHVRLTDSSELVVYCTKEEMIKKFNQKNCILRKTGWVNGHMDDGSRWTDGCTDARTEGWVDRRKDRLAEMGRTELHGVALGGASLYLMARSGAELFRLYHDEIYVGNVIYLLYVTCIYQ